MGGLRVIDKINYYLSYLDILLDNIPKYDRVCLKELTRVSFNLVNSKNIWSDIKYIDYIINYMLDNKYINYNMYIEVGYRLTSITDGLKDNISFK